MHFQIAKKPSFVPAIIAFQPEFVEPVVNITVAKGRDTTFACHVRHLGGYRVSFLIHLFVRLQLDDAGRPTALNHKSFNRKIHLNRRWAG